MELPDSLPKFVPTSLDVNKTPVEAKLLDSILNELKIMEKNKYDVEISYNLGKSIMQTIRWFSKKNSPFYNDKRLFGVFCIAGKLNHTIGMKRIMEKLHNRKQFYELAEFYIYWGEIFAKEQNRKRFIEIWDEAMKANAKPISKVIKAFRAMCYQYFQMADIMTDEIIENLEENESSEDSRVIFRGVKTSSKMQNRQLSDMREERSDSGVNDFLMNPSSTNALTSIQPSAECLQSSQLTSYDTSSMERFPPGVLYDVSCTTPVPPPRSAAVSSNAPLASPTPVPRSSLSLGKGNDSSIADQLKNIQLREVSAPALSNSAAAGGSNLLSKLEATPSKRKNQYDNSNSRTIGIDAAFPTNAVGSGVLRRSRKKQVSGTANIADSPKVNRKLPISNSLNQEEAGNTGYGTVERENSGEIIEVLSNLFCQELSKAEDRIVQRLRS